MSVQGLKELAAAIKAHQVTTRKNLMIGLNRAALFLQRESQLLVPVDTGNLKTGVGRREKGGQSIKKFPKGNTPEVHLTYEAAYAIYVHEDLEAKHKVGQAKFLEQPLREKRGRMLEIVKEAMQGAS